MNLPVRCNSIAAFVLRRERGGMRHLLLRRTGKRLRGHWQMVAGKIEKGETAWQAALREVREETGLHVREFYAADTVEIFYAPTQDLIDLTPVFVAMAEPHARVELSGEHDAFAWLTAAQAEKRLVFAEQRRILKHVQAQFVKRKPASALRIAVD